EAGVRRKDGILPARRLGSGGGGALPRCASGGAGRRSAAAAGNAAHRTARLGAAARPRRVPARADETTAAAGSGAVASLGRRRAGRDRSAPGDALAGGGGKAM